MTSRSAATITTAICIKHYYRGYSFHGASINVYAPVRYYPAGFYGWAYNPWGVPVAYAWGFRGNPWFGYYGFYFAPYPVYSNASLWLTDYMISNDLAAAYEAGKNLELAPSEIRAKTFLPNSHQM